MKWLERQARAALPPDELLKRLVAEVTVMTGHPPTLKDVDLDAVGAALRRVLAAWGEEAPDAIRVVELSARTLGDLGAGDLARRLLLFGSGLVTPAVWDMTGGDTLWILDLRRLAVDSGVQIELTVFLSLDAAIAAIADVWDAASGQGRLGLRHVDGTVGRLCGATPRDARRARLLAAELLDRGRARLRAAATARGWRHVPELIAL